LTQRKYSAVRDSVKLHLTIYDAILCRGVLNDLINDQSRQEVFFSFARALRKGGLLVLDVREWNASALRKEREPIFEKTIEVFAASARFE